MKHQLLDRRLMRNAFEKLDRRLQAAAHLVVGGGTAMVLAYDHPLATDDVDAFSTRGSLRLADMDGIAKEVARELGIAPDWLNPYFETYTYVLPADYAKRLRRIFTGQHLLVDALGPEDLLIMKCFAGRDKDLAHARRLLSLIQDVEVVERQLAHLIDRRIPKAERAADYFDDLRDEAEDPSV